MTTRVLLREGAAVREVTLAEAALALDDGVAVAWIDITPDLSKGEAEVLEKDLGIHALVLEDLVTDYPLPKIEAFEGYVYILAHGIVEGTLGDSIDFVEIDLIIGERFIVTHHRGFEPLETVRKECERRHLLAKGPAFVAHAILDTMVDRYLPAVERFDAILDNLEASVLKEAPTKETLERIFSIKRELFNLRRVASYQREVLQHLSRPGSPVLPEAVLPFMRDVYDHMGQVTFLAENYRELATNLLEMHLSMQSNRMNEVMKTLTMFSTTLLPISLVAGIYGMNFKTMPELEWAWGYPAALLLMLSIAVGMVTLFRRKGWL